MIQHIDKGTEEVKRGCIQKYICNDKIMIM